MRGRLLHVPFCIIFRRAVEYRKEVVTFIKSSGSSSCVGGNHGTSQRTGTSGVDKVYDIRLVVAVMQDNMQSFTHELQIKRL